MNLLGNGTVGDGSNKLVRNIVLVNAGLIIASVLAVNYLDLANRDGTLEQIASSLKSNKYEASLAKAPKPTGDPSRIVGIRYGNVDYTATASIPKKSSRFKNVVTDPSLGQPRR